MDRERIHFQVWMEHHGCEVEGIPEEDVRRVWRLCFRRLEQVKAEHKTFEDHYFAAADEVSELIAEMGREFGFPLRDHFLDGLKDIKRHVASLMEEVKALREAQPHSRYSALRREQGAGESS